MERQVIEHFEAALKRGYNIDQEAPNWYHFSKGRNCFQGGIKGERFYISIELFILDNTALEHLEKDMKKASKSIEGSTIQREGDSVWLSKSAPLAEVTEASIKEMLDDCIRATTSRAIDSLKTQHKLAPKRF